MFLEKDDLVVKKFYFLFLAMIGVTFAGENIKEGEEGRDKSPFDIRYPEDNIFKDVSDDYKRFVEKTSFSIKEICVNNDIQ